MATFESTAETRPVVPFTFTPIAPPLMLVFRTDSRPLVVKLASIPFTVNPSIV